jgi:hypothetical protein
MVLGTEGCREIYGKSFKSGEDTVGGSPHHETHNP